MSNILRRGKTYYARLHIPEARQADVGRALAAPSGIKREVVRTLQTPDYRTATQRRDGALAAMRADVDAALIAAHLQPLTDWTGAWQERAVERRAQMQAGRDVVILVEEETAHDGTPLGVVETTEAHAVADVIETERAELTTKAGGEIARRFAAIATGKGMTIAAAQKVWLAGEEGNVKHQTLAGHKAALAKLEAYLVAQGMPSFEGVELGQVSRRVAGEFLEARRKENAPRTVQREMSSWSGLWRWAKRRGYVEASPWEDQNAALRPVVGEPATVPDRGYTEGELVKLLRAGPSELAPNRGGYAVTFWDLMRLSLLTGARPNELLSLRRSDVLDDGAVVVIASSGRGKTASASRMMLHPYAARVLADRLAGLPDMAPDAPLWPEVPAQGGDLRRSKSIGTLYPAIRRRILGDGVAGVDFYSFRRTFLTACETAMNGGGRLNREIIARLAGHVHGALALDVYSDWSRLGRSRTIDGDVARKLVTLREAVTDAIERGLPAGALTALAETAGDRPAVLRTTPAKRRLR